MQRFTMLCIAAGLVAPGFQDIAFAAEDAAGLVLEEVIVVARRVDEDLQDVPTSITSMSADFVAKQGITSVNQAIELTPGATFTMFNKTQYEFSVRGISSQTEGAAGDPAIITVVDEVVISRDFAKSTEFFDVDRLEILRGPQGTSFGRNASGGLVHIVTRKPTHDFEAFVELTAGNQSLAGLDSVVNGSLSETVAGRLAVHYRDKDGYTEDLSTGRMLEAEQNLGLRGQLLYTPSDALSVLLKLDYSSDDDGVNARRAPDCTTPYLDLGPLFYQEPSCDPWKTDISDDIPLYLTRDILSASANVKYDLTDTLALTSITGYVNAESDFSGDIFGTPFDIVINRTTNDAWQLSQELRVDNARRDEGPHWLLGLFYLHDNHERDDDRDIVVNTPLGLDTLQRQASENETDSFGLYGQVEFELGDQTSLSLGGRWSHDEKNFDVGNAITGPLADLLIDPNDNPISETVSEDWSEFTASASLSRAFGDDVMAYLTASQGYKSGGFSGEPETRESALTPYDPETVFNVEAGIKAEWLGRRLRTNAAVFWIDVEDLQVIGATATGAPIISNAGGEKAVGAELEYAFLVTERFTIQGSVALIDAELEGTYAGEDVSGNRPPNVPEWTSTVAANVDFPLASGALLSARVDFQGRGDAYTEANEDPNVLKDSVGKLGARITWGSPNEKWQLSLWGKNLTNEEEALDHGVQAIVLQHPTLYAPPRSWGLTVRLAMN